MKSEKLNGISTEKTNEHFTEDINEVKTLQNQIKNDGAYVKKKLPKGAKLKRIEFTSDMAKCLVMIYRYYCFHPKAEFGHYYPNKELFAELKQNVGEDLMKKITRTFRQLKYWDCIVPMPTSPDEIIYKKGWWGITENGVKFVQKEIGLPKYAEIYEDFPYNHITIPLMITDLIEADELKELLKL